MISKTHISVQKLRRRQLNAKVYGSESAIFLILSFLFRLASFPGSPRARTKNGKERGEPEEVGT